VSPDRVGDRLPTKRRGAIPDRQVRGPWIGDDDPRNSEQQRSIIVSGLQRTTAVSVRLEPDRRRDELASGAADQIDKPFWNPRSGAFDGAQLRMAIVLRGWTVRQFAVVAKVSLACLYRALGGYGVTDDTATKIFEGLRQRQLLPLIPELANAR
jgi:hypothetical protein